MLPNKPTSNGAVPAPNTKGSTSNLQELNALGSQVSAELDKVSGIASRIERALAEINQAKIEVKNDLNLVRGEHTRAISDIQGKVKTAITDINTTKGKAVGDINTARNKAIADINAAKAGIHIGTADSPDLVRQPGED